MPTRQHRWILVGAAATIALLSSGRAHAHSKFDLGSVVALLLIAALVVGVLVVGLVFGILALTRHRAGQAEPASSHQAGAPPGAVIASRVAGILLASLFFAGISFRAYDSSVLLHFWAATLVAALLALLAGFLWAPALSPQQIKRRRLVMICVPLLGALLPVVVPPLRARSEHAAKTREAAAQARARRYLWKGIAAPGPRCLYPRSGSDEAGISCALALSPDGKLVATGSSSPRLLDLYPQLISVQTETVLPLAGRPSPARAVALCAEGKVLAIVEENGKLRLWSVQKEAYLPELAGAPRRARTAACSHSDRLVLGTDEGLQLLALDPPRLLTSSRADQPVSAVAIAANGERLAWAVGSVVHSAGIMQGKRLGASQPLAGHATEVTSLSFSVDGKLLASASRDSAVILWDAPAARQLRVIQRAASPRATQVAISADGKRLAVAALGWPIWQCPLPACEHGARQSLDTRRPSPEEGEYDQEMGRDHSGIAFSPDGSQLAVGYEGHLTLWGIAWKEGSGQRLRRIAGLTGHGDSVAFSPDGKLVAVAGRDQPARLFAISALVATIPPHPPHHADSIRSVAFDPSGGRIASGSDDGTIRLWATAPSLQLLRVLVGEHGPVLTVAFGPRGEQLAGGHRDGSVTIWSPDSGALRRALVGDQPIVSVAYSSDGKLLAVTDLERIRLWELESGRLTQTFRAPRPSSAVFGPGGELISSHEGFHGAIRWWSTPTGKQLAANTQEDVVALAISADGKILASSDLSGKLVLWSSRTRQSLGLLYSIDHALHAATFSANGELLATMTDRGVYLFRMRGVDLSALDPIQR